MYFSVRYLLFITTLVAFACGAGVYAAEHGEPQREWAAEHPLTCGVATLAAAYLAAIAADRYFR